MKVPFPSAHAFCNYRLDISILRNLKQLGLVELTKKNNKCYTILKSYKSIKNQLWSDHPFSVFKG